MHTKTLKGLQIVTSQLKLDILGNLIGQLKMFLLSLTYYVACCYNIILMKLEHLSLYQHKQLILLTNLLSKILSRYLK